MLDRLLKQKNLYNVHIPQISAQLQQQRNCCANAATLLSEQKVHNYPPAHTAAGQTDSFTNSFLTAEVKVRFLIVK